jgi:hypothetical protein
MRSIVHWLCWLYLLPVLCGCSAGSRAPVSSELAGEWYAHEERHITWLGILPVHNTGWQPATRSDRYVLGSDGSFDFEQSAELIPFIHKSKLAYKGDRAGTRDSDVHPGYYEVSSAEYSTRTSALRVVPGGEARRLSGTIRIDGQLSNDDDLSLRVIIPRPLGQLYTHEYKARLRRIPLQTGDGLAYPR